MNDNLLDVRNLHAKIGDIELLKGIDLSIGKGEIHVLMGPNGAGKSTLGNVIMAHPAYAMTDGEIIFEGEDISQDSTDVRARKGLFLSFQNPEELPGVSQENFLHAAKAATSDTKLRPWKFHKELQAKMTELNMDEQYASRYVNVGF